MNRRLLIPGFLVLILAGATLLCVFVYILANPGKNTTIENTETTRTNTATGTATTIKKNLFVTAPGASAPEEIAESKTVSQGDALKTSKDGRGIVTLPNGSTAVLDYDSSISIENLDESGTHTKIALRGGSVWASVQKVFGQGEFFEIRTQNAVAVVRGTSFGLTYHPENNSSTLFVDKGSVQFIPINPKTGGLDTEKAFTVPAGEKGMIGPGDTKTQSKLSPKETGDEWYAFNADDAKIQPTTPKVEEVSKEKAPADPTPKEPVVTNKSETPRTTFTPAEKASLARIESACDAIVKELTTIGYTDIQGLEITRVRPEKITPNTSGLVTIKGTGFECATIMQIGSLTLVSGQGFTVVDNDTITIYPQILPLGTSNITLSDSLDRTITVREAITVTTS